MFDVYYILFFTFVIGLCIGSFLNVVILRAFSGESIVLPPSKCPKCKEKIKWYDNVPLFSYLILGGKCRHCKGKISIQYPLIELLTGILFVFAMYVYGPVLTTFFICILFALGLVIATTDIKEKVVFDVHTISFAVVALILNLINGQIGTALIGLAVGAIVMELISRLGFLFIGKRAFGEGDTYIAAGVGALVGPKLFLLVLALSVFAQVLAILPSFVSRLWKTNQKVLAISLCNFLVFTLGYKILDYKLDLPLAIQVGSIGVIIALGGYLCYKLTKMTKTGEQLTYLPFGPSLLLMTFVVIFWGQAIVSFAKEFVA